MDSTGDENEVLIKRRNNQVKHLMINDDYFEEYTNIQISNELSLNCLETFKTDHLELDETCKCVFNNKNKNQNDYQIDYIMATHATCNIEDETHVDIMRNKKSAMKRFSRIAQSSNKQKMRNGRVTEASLAFNFNRLEGSKPKSTFYSLYKRKKLEDTSCLNQCAKN